MKIIGIIIARMTSTRLPGKVLFDLCGKTVFVHHTERMKKVEEISDVYLATSKSATNYPLIEEAKKLGIKWHSGAEEDLVDRFLKIGKKEKADAFIRIGCDKPLFSWEITSQMIKNYSGEDYIYVANKLGKGFAGELISYRALKEIHKHYRGSALTLYIREYPYKFKTRGIKVDDIYHRPEYNLLLDTPQDWELIKKVYEKLYNGSPIPLANVLPFLDDNPEIAYINKNKNEKNLNMYFANLQEEPVFKIFKTNEGKYIIKNRVNEIIEYRTFKNIVNKKGDWC